MAEPQRPRDGGAAAPPHHDHGLEAVPSRATPGAAAARGVRVVGVGHVALDHLFSVETLPTQAVKQPALRHRTVVGGMTANACVAAARLGAQVRICSPVGGAQPVSPDSRDTDSRTDIGGGTGSADDAGVPIFAAHFAREGIDARLVCVPGASSSVSAVIVDAHGNRMIVNHRGDALWRAGAFDTTQLDGADVLLTDPRCVAWAEAALREARRRALPSVLDADSAPRADLQRLVGLADWAVFSEPGRSAYVDTTDADALATALAAGARAAVVTCGERGLCWQRPGGAVQRIAAFGVAPVVDTTGAGDVFHGALAVALAEGRTDADALRFAAAAAALKCLQPDGALGAPARAEVEQLLRQRP